MDRALLRQHAPRALVGFGMVKGVGAGAIAPLLGAPLWLALLAAAATVAAPAAAAAWWERRHPLDRSL